MTAAELFDSVLEVRRAALLHQESRLYNDIRLGRIRDPHLSHLAQFVENCRGIARPPRLKCLDDELSQPQLANWPKPSQNTVTNLVPASTSRRAARQDCPNSVMP